MAKTNEKATKGNGKKASGKASNGKHVTVGSLSEAQLREILKGRKMGWSYGDICERYRLGEDNTVGHSAVLRALREVGKLDQDKARIEARKITKAISKVSKAAKGQ